jgi:cation diffusion facilitator family transporter
MVDKTFVGNADRLAGFTTFILIILGVIQIFAGELILRSIALTANGIDCIGDGFVSFVVWIGLYFFQKPANQRFNYGYYKMENLASSIAAIVMIGLAIYISIRSYEQLINPHKIVAPALGIILALIAAIIALFLGFIKYQKGKKSKMGSVKLEAFNTIKDGTASGLTVVALILTSRGFIIADAIIGFIIAGIIVFIGFAAIKESSFMLIDACNGECIDISVSVKQIAEEQSHVTAAHVNGFRKSGPIYQGELELIVSDDMTIKEFNELKHELQKKIQSIFPEIKRITITAKRVENE